MATIRKPAGILVSGNRFKTIARALPQNLRPSTLLDATTPQPVHRLDYATTGILLAGKTSSSIRALNKMFEAKKIEKTYYAITIGEMKQSGKILSNIDDKEAHTEYITEAAVPSERFGQLNLVRLIPKTGRRHQLRQHLSGIGNPILGDATYGNEPLILKGKGLYLHAFSLTFVHPFTQQKINIIDKFPKKFQKIFTKHQRSQF
ncbi:MAG: RNA pseudouridine synthase [Bacteroidota bacterium]